jgi:hydrogenase nickel incorporation protein HypA/HybF
MHEEALLRDIVRKIDQVARAQGARRVRGVTVWIGGLSHLTEAAFRARFPIAAEGTPAEGATVRIEQSHDVSDPRAQGVVLVSVDVDADDRPRPSPSSRGQGP